jgi:hypothetical protein
VRQLTKSVQLNRTKRAHRTGHQNAKKKAPATIELTVHLHRAPTFNLQKSLHTPDVDVG